MEIKCYAIKRTDIGDCYFSHAYNWDKGLHQALLYKTQKAAKEMADRKGAPCKIVAVTIREDIDG